MRSFTKTKEEIEIMAAGGRILRTVLDELTKHAKAGARLIDLDKLAREMIRGSGAEPAFLGYKPYGAEKPFPNSLCLSLNDVVVHGLPDGTVLKSGDVLKIDIGVLFREFYTDAAVTVGIGDISLEAKRLIETTKRSLAVAVENAVVGNTLGDVGYAIESFVSSRGFKVIRGLTGHGIGKKLHEDPVVNNFGKRGRGLELKSGMVLAIEPMVGAGTSDIVKNEDDSYSTADGHPSAHFENTVAITEAGVRILT